ncbi:MAG: malonyl-CoA decarboxylase family protein [Bacteroidetes bacterium]|nr:malonyl-CoA decarboxylase family protein [Bacteroidota bacterium]MBL6962897.1 malonyl-CoA decarboxylase family protein [Bacteroidota bacterium]
MSKQSEEIKIEQSIEGISQATIDKITKAWLESGKVPFHINPSLNKDDEEAIKNLARICIEETGGEISNQSRVVHLGMIYINLNSEGKARFLRILARDFDINTKLLNDKIRKLRKAKNEDQKIVAELELTKALIPPRVKLLRQFILLPDGFIFLKEMRRELIPLIPTLPRLKKLDNDIKRILRGFFDINLLDLVEINWNSPAILLEKLMEYEAVHEIKTWGNLKHRIHSDKRIYAFLHYKLPNEPLIFVEVALTKGMADNIHELLDESKTPIDPKDANTAIFYSITATQKGLKGISYGNFLIKRVVNKLSSEFTNLKFYATLSPIPKFRQWLEAYLLDHDDVLSMKEGEKIKKLAKTFSANEGLLKILNSDWHKNKNKREAIKIPLLRFCAHYLIHEKKGDRAFDPVAHFHLSNGAKIQHINWMADLSDNGLRQSAGLMVNYHYRLNKIVVNHEHYFSEAKVYASREVRNLLVKD